MGAIQSMYVSPDMAVDRTELIPIAAHKSSNNKATSDVTSLLTISALRCCVLNSGFTMSTQTPIPSLRSVERSSPRQFEETTGDEKSLSYLRYHPLHHFAYT